MGSECGRHACANVLCQIVAKYLRIVAPGTCMDAEMNADSENVEKM
jgi:hypothetical protein